MEDFCFPDLFLRVNPEKEKKNSKHFNLFRTVGRKIETRAKTSEIPIPFSIPGISFRSFRCQRQKNAINELP